MLASLLFLFAAATLPLIVVTRSLVSLPFVGAVVLVLGALGASLGIATGLSIIRLTLSLILVVNLGAATFLFRRRDPTQRWWPERSQFSDLALLTWFSIPSLSLLLLFPPAPVGWDARSIWWFHASWFRAGGQVAQDSLGNALLSWSQSDYPAGNPAAIATLWGLTGSVENLELAQTLTAVMSALAIAGLGLVLVHDRRSAASIGAATLLVATAGHLGQGLATQGYVDVLCATLLVTALVAHLCVENARLAIILGSLALAAASVTKNEGLAFGLIVLLAAAVATRHDRKQVIAWGIVGLLPALVWRLVLRVHLAEAIEDSAPMDTDPQVGERLTKSIPAVFREIAPVIGPTVIACVLLSAAVLLTDTRRNDLRLRSLVPACALLVVGIACALVASIVYATGPYDLPWWFATSLERVVITPELFALASLVTMIPVAAAVMKPTPDPVDGSATVPSMGEILGDQPEVATTLSGIDKAT